MAKLYKTTGEIVEITPENKKYFSYKELQKYIGENERENPMIEIVPLTNSKLIIVNEKGKLIGLKTNMNATNIWKKEYPLNKYPYNNDQLVVGNTIICENNEIQ